MRNTFFVIPVMASAALLSACNTTDHYYYSTGPWGPANIQRDAPRYSAPWGSQQAAFVPPLYIDGGGFDPVTRAVPPPVGRLEVILPPDPMPTRPIPGQPFYERSVLDPQSQTGVPSNGQTRSRESVAPAMTETPPSAVTAAPTRPGAYAGTWRAIDEKGVTCRIQLSTTSTLDLYKASSSGCSHPSLRIVNSWSFANNAVVLYAHGRVVARLSGLEASLTGVFDGTPGATIRMER